MKNKALFLDRDGVINHDLTYVHKVEDLVFVDGIFELTKKAVDKGYIIIVVTNQAGIGHGLYTEEDHRIFTEYKEQEFTRRGVKITKTYHCPFHPEAELIKYRMESEDRKPDAGMIFKAAQEFNINLTESLLIGDRDSDIEAAHKAGLKHRVQFLHGAFEVIASPIATKLIKSLAEAEELL
jgi:D-glycero-D-manno-heptose 1,7-bisphosphate phosphatase